MISFARFLALSCTSLLLLSFSNCKSNDKMVTDTIFQQDPPFTFTQGSYQEWTAGTQQGGSGTNVNLRFEKLNQNIILQQFYFQNQEGVIVAGNEDGTQYKVFYKNPVRPDIIMDSDPTQEAQNTPPVKFPFDLKENEAVLSYLDHDVVLFYKIQNLERKEPVFYPSAPPVDDN